MVPGIITTIRVSSVVFSNLTSLTRLLSWWVGSEQMTQSWFCGSINVRKCTRLLTCMIQGWGILNQRFHNGFTLAIMDFLFLNKVKIPISQKSTHFFPGHALFLPVCSVPADAYLIFPLEIRTPVRRQIIPIYSNRFTTSGNYRALCSRLLVISAPICPLMWCSWSNFVV